MGDFRSRFRDLSSKMSLVRGRGAYGRRPNRSVLSEIAKDGPVSVHHQNADDTFTIETTQNVNPVIDANVSDFNSGSDGYTPSRELRKVASIPMIEVHRLMKQGINIFNEDDWPKIAAKLDDPDWLKFRTAPGRISRRPHREFYRASTEN